MKALWYLCLTMVAVGIGGCFVTSSTRALSSNFAFPNSDLVPIGPVSAETTHWSFIMAPSLDKPEFDELVQDALREKSGGTLVDYVIEVDTFYPLLPLVYYSTFTINGTAVRVTQIGRQIMH
jgi:hypothetical protein